MRRPPLVMIALGVLVGSLSGCSGGPTSSTRTSGSLLPVASEAPSSVVASPTSSPAPTLASIPPTAEWRLVPDQPSLTTASLQLVVWTGARFVATGSDGDRAVVFDSPDGRTWHAQSALPARGLRLGAYAFRRLAVGPMGVVIIGWPDGERPPAMSWYSPDGLTWTVAPDQPSLHATSGEWLQMNGVTAVDRGWIAVGEENPVCMCTSSWISAVVWSSGDGLHWTRKTVGEDLAHAAMTSVTAGGPGLVAVGHALDAKPAAGTNVLNLHAVVWTSTDGASWSRVPDTDAFHLPGGTDPAAVVSNGKRLVAVGTTTIENDLPASVAWWSDDGRGWIRAEANQPPHGPTDGVVVAPGGFMALESDASGPSSCLGGIWTSVDGTTWSCAVTSGAPAGFSPRSIAVSPDAEVVVGNGNAEPYPTSILVRDLR
jgi:hypothetical protein